MGLGITFLSANTFAKATMGSVIANTGMSSIKAKAVSL